MREAKKIVIPLDSVDQLLQPCPPSPFRQRRLREEADAFLVERASALPRNAPVQLLITLPQGQAEREKEVVETIHQHFNWRRIEAEKQLHRTQRFGWRSLVIALLFLSAVMVLVQAIQRYFPATNLVSIITAGLTVFAWVALWRPCELLLYEWYPFKRDARVFRKLEKSGIEFSYRDQAVSQQRRDESCD